MANIVSIVVSDNSNLHSHVDNVLDKTTKLLNKVNVTAVTGVLEVVEGGKTMNLVVR